MAYVEKRGPRKYRARYRDPDGKERSQTFETRRDAERFLADTLHAVNVGGYVDPVRGRTTFGDYSAGWFSLQVTRPSTLERVETNLRVHLLPMFAKRRMASIRPSDVQAFVSGLSKSKSPSTVHIVYRQLVSILNAAVTDGVIATSPCRGIKLPEVTHPPVVPLTAEQVFTLIEHAPERLRALILVGAGSGLRQGELLGLQIDRVDFLRRTIRVDQQLVKLKGQVPVLGPPKSKASMRTVPVPQLVLDALAEHLAAFPSDAFVFKSGAGEVWRRQTFGAAFRGVVKRAGLPTGTTCHDLRHFYASALIAQGESVRVVQERLGHASAVETLSTYAHLWHDSDDRTREAIERALGNNSRPARGLEAV